MTEGRPEGGVFNVASQRAGVINNVAGDQRVQGGQHGAAAPTIPEVKEQLSRLRGSAKALDLYAS
jgi:hypothetical protein